MMTRILPLLFCFVCLSVPVYAAEIRAKDRLVAATVFQDRAMLSREGRLSISSTGDHVAVFENLSASIMPHSLRVEGQGTASIVIGTLSHKIVNQAQLVNEQEQAINRQIETLEKQKATLGAEKQSFETQKQFLTSLQAKALQDSNDEISRYDFNVDQWASVAGTLQKSMAEISVAQIAIDERTKEIDEQIQKLRNDLNQIHTGQKRVMEVRVPLEAKKAGEVTLVLNYQVPNATWKPVYDARLDTQAGDLEIVQYGAVTQRTGEDWSDIKLTLSTAQPHRNATAPPINPMWVDLFDPNARQSRNMLQGLANFAMDSGVMMEAAAVPMQKVEMQSAAIITSGFNAEYIIPGTVNVPLDGTESKLLIGRFDTETSLERHIRPQLSTDAFLLANMVLQGEAPLLPGQVSLFRDGAFIGRTSVPLLRAGDDHGLSFGIDDQIDVSRNVLKDERSESGILVGKTQAIEKYFVTTVTNLRNDPVNIVISEAVPVPRHDDIDFTIHRNKTTAGYKEDQDNQKGILRWEIELQPEQDQEISLAWNLSWPQDLNLSGLR